MRIMHYFRYVDGHLHCEGLRVERLAREYGTPLYVYSQKTLEDHYGRLDAVLAPLDNLICYAVKANSNLAVLRTFADLGSGFDIVSAGELERVIAAGGNPARCVFAGVGKTEAEIALALRRGIYAFNVESEAELARIDRVAARLRKRAPVAVRVNPNVDAQTHAKITTGTYENKFGIAFESVLPLYQRAARLKHLRLRGIQMHIGSQLTEVKPFESAVRRVAPLTATLAKKYGIEFFSIGGGIGIVYESALASGQPDLVGDARGQRTAHPRHVRIEARPPAASAGPENPGRARPVSRRQRGHPCHSHRVREEDRRETVSHCRRRHERSGASGILRRVSRNPPAPLPLRSASLVRRGRTDLRVGRFLLPRPAFAGGGRRRIPRVVQRWGLRRGHGLEYNSRPFPGDSGR